SGTLGWKNKPSTMPIATAAIPIMLSGFFRSSARESAAPGFLSRGPNLFGELDVPDRSGGQRQTVGHVHAHADAVGSLQQPEAVQAGAVFERVSHSVRRPDGQER